MICPHPKPVHDGPGDGHPLSNRKTEGELSEADQIMLLQHGETVTPGHWTTGHCQINLFHYVKVIVANLPCLSGVSRIGKSHSKPGVEPTTARYLYLHYLLC